MSLYGDRGHQCSSCGLRFPVSDTAGIDAHHDWHFRTNKVFKRQNSWRPYFYIDIREPAQASKAAKNPCRQWFYAKNDWFQLTDSKEKAAAAAARAAANAPALAAFAESHGSVAATTAVCYFCTSAGVWRSRAISFL